MAWITKLVDFLKIPVKVLLPATWLFSAAVILFPDRWLDKLGVLQWKNGNQFALGLLFLITSCLILVYSFIYLKKQTSKAISRLSLNRATIKSFFKMSDIEKAIILKVYHSPNITCELDYGHPVVKGLIARQYLYGGGDQLVKMNFFSNAIPIRLTLQPYIYDALNYYKSKLAKQIQQIERKLSRKKKQSSNSKLNARLEELKGYYNMYFNGDI